jgi:hypothetical protein
MATRLNQCLAVALWGVVEALLAPARWCRATGPLLAAPACADERGSRARGPACRRTPGIPAGRGRHAVELGRLHGPPMRVSPSPS